MSTEPVLSTETPRPPSTASSPLARVFGLVYGVVVYLFFLGTFLYSVGFVTDARVELGGFQFVGKSIDRGAGSGALTAGAVLVNVLALGLFAVQHSVMARAGFKKWWTRVVPPALERSTYVLAAALCLALLMVLWRPVTVTVWDVESGAGRAVLIAGALAGWGLVLLCTFLIDHFDLFGLRQVHAGLRGRTPPPYRFATPLLYRLVRHPLYLGFLIAFWVAPTMTVGHLLFSAATTGYVLIAIQLEERDLVRDFGDDYRGYRGRVPMLVPGARIRR